MLRSWDLPARGYASHGESWSYALALRLACVHELLSSDGGEPVLILDDVFAELDTAAVTGCPTWSRHAEQNMLIAALCRPTCPNASAVPFDVAGGAVTPMSDEKPRPDTPASPLDMVREALARAKASARERGVVRDTNGARPPTTSRDSPAPPNERDPQLVGAEIGRHRRERGWRESAQVATVLASLARARRRGPREAICRPGLRDDGRAGARRGIDRVGDLGAAAIDRRNPRDSWWPSSGRARVIGASFRLCRAGLAPWRASAPGRGPRATGRLSFREVCGSADSRM